MIGRSVRYKMQFITIQNFQLLIILGVYFNKYLISIKAESGSSLLDLSNLHN